MLQPTIASNESVTNQTWWLTALAPLQQAMQQILINETPLLPIEPLAEETLAQCPAFARLAITLQLTPFEQLLLLFCCGVELDTGLANLCGELQAGIRRPTVELIFTLFGANWGALHPRSALRYWQLVELSPHTCLSRTVLQVSEWLLFCVLGYTEMDSWLRTFVKPITLSADASLHKEMAWQLVEHWQTVIQQQARPVIPVLLGADTYRKQQITALAALQYKVSAYYFNLWSLPNHRYDLDSYRRLLEREMIIRNAVYLIECERLQLETNSYHLQSMLATLLHTLPANCVLSARSRGRWFPVDLEASYVLI